MFFYSTQQCSLLFVYTELLGNLFYSSHYIVYIYVVVNVFMTCVSACHSIHSEVSRQRHLEFCPSTVGIRDQTSEQSVCTHDQPVL